jgi:hypothetical protein
MSATCFISRREVSNSEKKKICEKSTNSHPQYTIPRCKDQKTRLTGLDDALDEVVSRNELVVILIHLPEEIRQPRLLVVHELQEPLPPVVPREVVRLLFLLQIGEMVVEFALSLPRQHPDVPPLIVEEFHAGRSEFGFAKQERGMKRRCDTRQK